MDDPQFMIYVWLENAADIHLGLRDRRPRLLARWREKTVVLLDIPPDCRPASNMDHEITCLPWPTHSKP
ncbi:MAG: hypothetical protein M0C28_44390 [Candidatus Moduliflexus flocculans]|nr:hypothetical protein [Candidatus Moduliflexus flocculans]